MARYRKIDPRIWNDRKFRALSDSAKLVFLMLLTHPHMTALGAMRASMGGLADELGWTSEAFREAFREVSQQGIAKHDPEACCVWLPNFLTYNAPESPNVVRAWVGALDLIPECDMKNKAIQAAKVFAEGLSEAFREALPEAFAKAMPNPEQEQEQEQEIKDSGRAKRDRRKTAERFDEFWSAYPRRVKKPDALKAWKNRELDRKADAIIADVQARTRSDPQWLESIRLIPHPTSYLNAERWTDEWQPDRLRLVHDSDRAADQTSEDAREQAIQRLLRSPCPLTRREAEEWADEKFQRTGSYESC